MANYIVTGHTGEAHITSDDIRTFNAYTLGHDDFALPSNEELALSILDNHTIRMNSGDILIQGIHARIPYGNFETLNFEPGTAGYNRIDYIVATYENNGEIESVEFNILQGDSTTGTPVPPTPQTGDLLHGDTYHDMVLYAVNFEGNLITGTEKLFRTYVAKKDISGMAYTLLANRWDSNNVYSFESDYPSDNWDIEVQLSADATAGEISAWNSAQILAAGDLTNRLIAKGAKPSINIPVLLRLEGGN